MEDIRIIAADKERTHRALRSDVLYDVFFELSEAPPAGWRRLFDSIWSDFLKYGRAGRTAYISGKYLVLICRLVQVEIEAHLAQLKEAIKGTNEGYRNRIAQAAKEAEKERKKIAKALDKLTFDG